MFNGYSAYGCDGSNIGNMESGVGTEHTGRSVARFFTSGAFIPEDPGESWGK